MEKDLRRAIESQLLQVVYQPILHTESGALAGFEALCRWEVEPREFIPIAEESGLIVPLGRFMLHEAARRAAEWGACISVNVSPRELAHAGFTRLVEEALAESGARAADLRLDVLEPAPDQDSELVLRTLADLCTRVGVGAHLDGFGACAASLRFLQRFPGDAIKVDRRLVSAMVGDPGSDAIVRAIVALAHSLGLGVVGTGVESAEQLERLRLLGCELAQGFHLSAPLGAEAGAQLAAVRRPAGPCPAGPCP